MITEQQKKCLDLIKAQIDELGYPPSFEELKDRLGLKSKSGIHRILSALEERGYIKRLPGRARAIEVFDGDYERGFNAGYQAGLRGDAKQLGTLLRHERIYRQKDRRSFNRSLEVANAKIVALERALEAK